MRTPGLGLGLGLLLLLVTGSALPDAGLPFSRSIHSGGFRPLPPQHQHGNRYPGQVYPAPQPGPYPPPVHPPLYPGPGPLTAVHIEAEKIVLNCVVRGYSSTPIQWLKPDVPGLVAEGGAVLWERRHLAVETAVSSGGRRSRLVIYYPQPRHLGLYLCRVAGAASAAFRVGGGGGGGFQPVYYHGRSGGSNITALEPAADQGPEQGQENDDGTLTEDQKQNIIDTIKRELREVESAVEDADRL